MWIFDICREGKVSTTKQLVFFCFQKFCMRILPTVAPLCKIFTLLRCQLRTSFLDCLFPRPYIRFLSRSHFVSKPQNTSTRKDTAFSVFSTFRNYLYRALNKITHHDDIDGYAIMPYLILYRRWRAFRKFELFPRYLLSQFLLVGADYNQIFLVHSAAR